MDAALTRVRRTSTPPELYFVVSAVFHYLGPSFAVLLFARVEPVGVAWLRIASAAAVFAVWRRPWRGAARSMPGSIRLVIELGLVLVAMNVCFYLAIARLPLGTVAAIEFVPVVALAAIGMQAARNVSALCVAVVGVGILVEVHLAGAPLGIALAFANAALFACYIVLAHRLARNAQLAAIDGLAAAMVVAAVAVTPLGGAAALPAFADPVALAAGVGVGVSSSVVPYVFDQLAMARLSRATYCLMVSLLPATASVVGLLVLGQTPTARDLAGVALVVVGVGLHREHV
jgi:inner membrane transporter RhtA